jgi:hypothetical protein
MGSPTRKECAMVERSRAYITLSVLEYLIRKRGTALSVEAICEAISCSVPQAQAALELLTDVYLIDRLQSVAGVVTYLIRM